MTEPFEPYNEYAVVELVTISGGGRVLAVSDTDSHEEEAIESARRRAATANSHKQDRYFGVIPITWIRQC